jgi:uncharacterized NAD-dependent epimerase/dehydratase family protein
VGIKQEIMAIEAMEPTRVVGISLNLRNVEDKEVFSEYETKYSLPAADVYRKGASRLLDAIINEIGEKT